MRYALILAAVLVAAPASAQIVIGPTQVTFAAQDADFAITTAYQVEFFQCTTVTATPVACTHGTTPVQTVTWPKSVVTTSTSPQRAILLSATPSNGTLPSFPSGVGFVAEAAAVGDPSLPGVAGTSPFSADSNPFFGSARTPAAPGSVGVK